MNRDGPGVLPGEDRRPTLGFFFKQLGRKFWKIFSVNLLMLFQIIPLLLIWYVNTTGPKAPSLSKVVYAPLLGAQTASYTGAGASLLNTVSIMEQIPSFDTPIYWIIGALIVFLVVTFGWQQVGSTYVLRNLTRGDAVFVVSDYFYAIKRNLKQGFIMGVLDCAVIFMLGFDFLYFFSQPADGFTSFMYAAIIAIALVYIFMRFYIYLMLITFDMKLGKILKNALIFTALGIKRNLMAALGILILTVLFVCLIVVGVNMGLYVTILLPFLFYPGITGFMSAYAAYPVIQKYMIDPIPTSNK